MKEEHLGKYAANKINYAIILNIYFTAKPFPINDEEYYDSVWYQWIERIQEGQRHEQERVSDLVNQCGDVELFAEDFLKAEELSETMYAALAVAIWSHVEVFIKNTIYMCEICLKLKPHHYTINKTKGSVGKYIRYFNENLGINLKYLQCYDFVDAVRIISNCFKHNDGIYDKKIEETLEREWNLEDGKPISYSKIHYRELIINCGLFCNDLKGYFKKKL